MLQEKFDEICGDECDAVRIVLDVKPTTVAGVPRMSPDANSGGGIPTFIRVAIDQG